MLTTLIHDYYDGDDDDNDRYPFVIIHMFIHTAGTPVAIESAGYGLLYDAT